MSEEETQETEETKQVETPVEELGLVQRAEKAAKEIQEANKKALEILEKNEEMFAKQLLAGRSNGGTVEEKPKELTPEEYANEVLNGRINPLKVK